MAIRLIQLSAMLDEHFRLAPPLDEKNVPVSGEVSEFGTGVSLGDGTSMENVRGLENILVVEKANSFDKVRQISMKDWLQKTIRENPDPVAVAASVQNLLTNGHLSYFEQGREFATRLGFAPGYIKLAETPVSREVPPVKPTLTFFQKFKRLFNWLPQDELDDYNRALLTYELQKKSLASSALRCPVDGSPAGMKSGYDGKGRILGGAGNNKADVIKYVSQRHERSMLSPEARRDVEYDIQMGANHEEAIALRIGPKQNGEKILAEIYKNGRPAGINNLQDHINARIAKQESFSEVQKMKDPANASALKLGIYVSDALISVMNGNGDDHSLYNKITSSRAYGELLRPQNCLTLAKNNQIFDQFARNLEQYPIEGITPKQLENLLDVCIEPHKMLRNTMEAAREEIVIDVVDNKQPEIQIENQIEKQIEKQIEIQPEIQPEKQIEKENILPNKNLEKVNDLKIEPKLNEPKLIEPKLNDDKMLADMYPFGKPAEIKSLRDHINARIAKQESISEVQKMKDPIGGTSSNMPFYIENAIIAAMKDKGDNTFSPAFAMLSQNKAYRSLIQVKGGAHELAKNNQLFDQFAQNLENDPIKGITPKQIENLLDICLEPHNKLRLAVEASKNGDMLKIEGSNKQKEKQAEKGASKKKPSGLNIG